MHITKHIAMQNHAPASVHCAEICISISISQTAEENTLVDNTTRHFYRVFRWTHPQHGICTMCSRDFNDFPSAAPIHRNTFYFYSMFLHPASCENHCEDTTQNSYLFRPTRTEQMNRNTRKWNSLGEIQDGIQIRNEWE